MDAAEDLRSTHLLTENYNTVFASEILKESKASDLYQGGYYLNYVKKHGTQLESPDDAAGERKVDSGESESTSEVETEEVTSRTTRSQRSGEHVELATPRRVAKPVAAPEDQVLASVMQPRPFTSTMKPRKALSFQEEPESLGPVTGSGGGTARRNLAMTQMMGDRRKLVKFQLIWDNGQTIPESRRDEECRKILWKAMVKSLPDHVMKLMRRVLHGHGDCQLQGLMVAVLTLDQPTRDVLVRDVASCCPV